MSLLHKEGKRSPIDACYFFCDHSSTFLSLTSLSLFSFLFPFQFFVFLALVYVPLPLMVIFPIYIESSLHDFSLLPLLLTSHFCLLWTPLRSAHYPSGGSASTTSGHAQCFLSLPIPIPQKILIHSLLPYIFLYPLLGKTLGLSLPISLACIKWPQPVYYLFWAKMPSQQSNSQKRSWLDTRNRPFPPSTKPHPP